MQRAGLFSGSRFRKIARFDDADLGWINKLAHGGADLVCCQRRHFLFKFGIPGQGAIQEKAPYFCRVAALWHLTTSGR